MGSSVYQHFGLPLSEMFYKKYMTKANYYENLQAYERRIIFEGMAQHLLAPKTSNRKFDIAHIGNYLINSVLDRYAASGWVKDEISQWPKLKALADTFYELNVQDFQARNKRAFNAMLQDFTAKHHFHEVQDLTTLTGKTGLYLLVLKRYRAIYLGATTTAFKNEICRHWRTQPAVVTITAGPVLPIEAFGAQDTSRIFIREINEPKQIAAEKLRLVSQLPKAYNLNRVAGVDNADGIGVPAHEKDYGKLIWEQQPTSQLLPRRYAAMFAQQPSFSSQELTQYQQLVANKDHDQCAYLNYVSFMLAHASAFGVETRDGLKFCNEIRTLAPEMINWGLYLLLKKAVLLFDHRYADISAANKKMYRYDHKRQAVIYGDGQVIPNITSEKLHKLRVHNFFAHKGLEYQTAS